MSPGSRIYALIVLGLMIAGTAVNAQKTLLLSVKGPAERDAITGTLTYQIRVTNPSASPVLDVRVTDTLPDSTEFMGVTNSYDPSAEITTNGANVVCLFHRINSSDTAQMTLTVLPMAVGSITDAVSVSAEGMPSVTATAPFTVLSTQLSIHDPSMAKEGDTYYLFSSGPGIMFYTSMDMIHWKMGGRVFPGEPSWAKSMNRRFDGREWAPDIERHDGKWYLYYAVSSPGVNNSAIGVTINQTLDPASPDYHWQDQGIVLESIPNRDLWNAIDPNVIVDANGTPWMDFGSFWEGIKLVKLAPNWKEIAEPQEWHAIAKRDRSVLEDDLSPGPAEIEGPFIFQKGDYYYLFVSWGLCCRGVHSTYKIVMGRSKHVGGPYFDREGVSMALGGGTLLLGGNKSWAGQGGCSVYDFDGTDYLVFHAYEMADHGLQKLRIAKLDWDKQGWPVIDENSLHAYKSIVIK
jgi:arabinan endo-1,5-alpha-L-arabinosidase